MRVAKTISHETLLMQAFFYDGATDLEGKADWLELVRRILATDARRLTAIPGRMNLPWAAYPRCGAEFEAWSRPLWALIPVVMGFQAEGRPLSEWAQAQVADYRRALVAGTRPDHAASWPPLGDLDQRLVDSTMVGLALGLLPQIFGEGMEPSERRQVVAWLGRVNACRYPENNWRFFRVLVLAGLQAFVREWPESSPASALANAWEQTIEADLQLLDSFYLDHGWYGDGRKGLRDYYVPFGFHFYGLLLGALRPEHPLVAVFRSEAIAHLEAYGRLFDTGGAGVPYGRSQTYRFAQGSLWAICATVGLYRINQEGEEGVPEWFTLGYVRANLTRHLRYWLSQPIFDAEGTLSVGYGYPNVQMAEEYNAFGSPGWGYKAFWFLALPESHAFWSAPHPATEALGPADGVYPQPEAHWLMGRSESGAHAWFLNAGQWREEWMPRHAEEKYAKFAYSSRFGWAVSTAQRGLFHTAVDSSLAVSEDGEYWRLRGRTSEVCFEGGAMASTWRPGPRLSVRTWLLPWEGGHVRIHRFLTAGNFYLCEGGFACPDEGSPVTDSDHPAELGDRWVGLRSGEMRVGGALLALAGACGGGEMRLHRMAPQAHVLFPQAHLPILGGWVGAEPGSEQVSLGEWRTAVVVSAWFGGVSSVTSPGELFQTEVSLEMDSEQRAVAVHLSRPSGPSWCLQMPAVPG